MENLPIIHQTEEPLSPAQCHNYSAIKIEPSEYWNPPLIHPTNSITETIPTYTSLEPVYPESSYASPNTQYFSLTSTFPAIQPQYTACSDLQESNDYSLLHSTLYRDPDLNQTARDEGLGSSPSSFSSTTPPLPQQQTIKSEPFVSSSSTANYDSFQRSTSSTPESIVSSNFSTALECSNCGNRHDIFWVNTHYLCRQCLPERIPVVHPPPEESNPCKRKRTMASTKNQNQVCTNCEATHSKLWRRSISTGNTVCNACGLYEKLHHSPRPKHMRKDTIQSRKRKPKASQTAKVKNSARRNSRKSQHVSPSEQEMQYIPNDGQHYTLPTYNTFHGKDLSLNNGHHSSMLPPMNSQSFFNHFRPEMYNAYNPVPPNDIINVSHNLSSTLPFTNS